MRKIKVQVKYTYTDRNRVIIIGDKIDVLEQNINEIIKGNNKVFVQIDGLPLITRSLKDLLDKQEES